MRKPLVARFCHGLLVCQGAPRCVRGCILALWTVATQVRDIDPMSDKSRWGTSPPPARHGSEQRTMILWKRRSVAGVTARRL